MYLQRNQHQYIYLFISRSPIPKHNLQSAISIIQNLQREISTFNYHSIFKSDNKVKC